MERFTRMFLIALLLVFGGMAVAQPVDINTADVPALAAGLNGVGTAKARAIVAYRKQNGPFATADELTRVKGIGDRILDLNRGNILVSAGGKDSRH